MDLGRALVLAAGIPVAWHVIVDLVGTVRGMDNRPQDRGQPQIFLVAVMLFVSRNLEMPAVGLVEDAGKQRGRIEIRQAQPVDAAVGRYQRGTGTVPYDSIVVIVHGRAVWQIGE